MTGTAFWGFLLGTQYTSHTFFLSLNQLCKVACQYFLPTYYFDLMVSWCCSNFLVPVRSWTNFEGLKKNGFILFKGKVHFLNTLCSCWLSSPEKETQREAKRWPALLSQNVIIFISQHGNLWKFWNQTFWIQIAEVLYFLIEMAFVHELTSSDTGWHYPFPRTHPMVWMLFWLWVLKMTWSLQKQQLTVLIYEWSL